MRNLAAVLFCFGFVGTVLADNGSKNNKITWPDYKNWTVVISRPVMAPVSNEDLGNDYIASLAIQFGTETIHAPNSEESLEEVKVVVETSVLGNGVVIRALALSTPGGLVVQGIQLLINNQWVDCSLNGLRIYLLDPRALLCKSKLAGLLIAGESLDGKPVELRLENKER